MWNSVIYGDMSCLDQIVSPLFDVGKITKAEVGFILHVDHDRHEMCCQENNLYTVGTDHVK